MPFRHKPFPKGMDPILDTLRGPGLYSNPETDMPKLIKMLKEGSLVDRNHACVGIAEIAKTRPENAREAYPALLEAFNRWGVLTKAIVTETFVELQDWRALPVLIRNVNCKNPELRSRIEWALSNIPAVTLRPIE
jgi:hypothetical protein